MRAQPEARRFALIRGFAFALALLPLARLIHGAGTDGLGPNPIEFVTRATGTWTFNLLLLTLAVTPLRRLTGWNWLLRLRRMLGLFVFFYACLHFMTFVWFDHFFEWAEIARDVAKRPFVTAGFLAFVLLWPIAVTSNSAAVRRLGGRRWQALHRSVYAIGIIACVHYFWLVKPVALLYPIAYSTTFVILMLLRLAPTVSRPQ